MKISAKIDYACRALLELSLHWPSKGPLSIHAISQKQHIPIKFLVQILLNLKQFGFVESTRGKKGGYILGKPPGQITLREVVQDFSEHKLNGQKTSNILGSIWQEAQNQFYAFLEEITFEEIARRQKKIARVPMYTI